MERGDIRWYTFRPPDKRRPVLIVTRTSVLRYLNEVTVAPLTTHIREIASEVYLTPLEDGVVEPCVANCDHLSTVPKRGLGGLITTLSKERLLDVDRAICFALGIDYLQP